MRSPNDEGGHSKSSEGTSAADRLSQSAKWVGIGWIKPHSAIHSRFHTLLCRSHTQCGRRDQAAGHSYKLHAALLSFRFASSFTTPTPKKQQTHNTQFGMSRFLTSCGHYTRRILNSRCTASDIPVSPAPLNSQCHRKKRPRPRPSPSRPWPASLQSWTPKARPWATRPTN